MTDRPPRFAALPPLSLYVHLPWCVRKCPYCDFNSHEARGELPQEAYVDALLADLEHALPRCGGARCTPCSSGAARRASSRRRRSTGCLRACARDCRSSPVPRSRWRRIPDTFERERFAGFFAAGVNRVSIGVQSFDAAKLAALGRIHGADDARRAAEAAMMIFGNVNLDLMFALPGQTLARVRGRRARPRLRSARRTCRSTS